MNTDGYNEELGRLEANAGQLLTAIQWLAQSLEEEAANGRKLGLSLAVHMGGPVRALSTALLNLNYGVSELLAAAESDLREQAAVDAADPVSQTVPRTVPQTVLELRAPLTIQ